MCTAARLKTRDFYFGRTLDYDFSYGEQIVITPRNFGFDFRHSERLKSHYAIIGMAYVCKGYPLYYDGANEKGLAMAGLNFVGNAFYSELKDDKCNVSQFEFIPWVLSQCACVSEARELLESTNLVATPFNAELAAAELHWMIADKDEAIVVESVKEGLRVYPNPAGVLTNNPTFPEQLFRLNDYMSLSIDDPKNTFSPALALTPYSRGMGALGLPGDLSSQSRFVRAAFTLANSVSGADEKESVSQFFHILGTVSQTKGCCRLKGGRYEHTIYTSCINANKGIYYYTTYNNHSINAVNMHSENLDASRLYTFPLALEERIGFHNQNHTKK